MTTVTDDQIGQALAALGHYRVTRAQVVAAEPPPDGVTGALLLALSLRETFGHNVEGGAKLQDGHWVAQDDPKLMDVGVFQISRAYHADALKRMPGVKAGTWAPAVKGKTANSPGYCPRFEEQLRFVVMEFTEAVAYAADQGVAADERAQFAAAAHNAGPAGALDGYRNGNLDLHTAHGDYSADVIAKRAQVNRWLAKHPNWRWAAT